MCKRGAQRLSEPAVVENFKDAHFQDTAKSRFIFELTVIMDACTRFVDILVRLNQSIEQRKVGM